MSFSSFLIPADFAVKQAMRQLESSAGKILFVVDKHQKLIGSVTDGDIRRWILNKGDLDHSIDQVCNLSPFTVTPGYTKAFVKGVMKKEKIHCIPVLDDSKTVIELLFWDVLFEGISPQKIRKSLEIPVVIMAGGMGSRLAPFTTILPKPLIPLGDKSILEKIIDQFLDYHCQHFYISVNYKSKIIKSYFEELNPPYSLTYLYEDSPLGTAGCLQFLKEKVSGSFLVTNCDILVEVDYAKLLQFHQKNKSDITLVGSMKHYAIPYGVCEIENGGKLVRINEKPEMSFLVNTGMYIVESRVLDMIPSKEVFHMTHLIEKVTALGGKVDVYPITENAWTDIGEWTEYKHALKHLKIDL